MLEIDSVPEQLDSFFRSNYRLMNLPRYFGSIHEESKHVWNWNLSESGEDIRRSVKLSFYPYPSNIIEITAKVSPKNFWEKNNENERNVGILRLNRVDRAINGNRAWIRGQLSLAGEIVLSMSLLEVKFEDSIPVMYRDVM